MDLSHYQDKIDLTKGQYDFCIIKATEGIGFTDKSFDKFAIQLTKLNKLIGCYHFARPDLHGTIESMKEEANWFITEVSRMDLLGKAILVLDWEKEPMDREELVSAWCETVLNETGVHPFIYGSRSKLTKWRKAGWAILDDYPIWSASWPSIKRFDIGVNPNLVLPSGQWDIWQYSSTGKYPDFSGNVDLDLTTMDSEMWAIHAYGYKLTNEKEIITPAMQWCIDREIFAGDGAGHYMPKELMTREQAAQVIYNIFHTDSKPWGMTDYQLKNILNAYYGKLVNNKKIVSTAYGVMGQDIDSIYKNTDSIKEGTEEK